MGLVDEARRSLDQTEKIGLYAQAERILAEEVPILPLSYERWHMLLKPWVKRYPPRLLSCASGRTLVISPLGPYCRVCIPP